MSATTKWHKLTEDCHPEEETKFLTVAQGDDGEAYFEICTWYRKGTKVKCDLKQEYAEKATENESAEERLLRTIFGAKKDIEIPEDGFYRITGDYIDGDEKHKEFAVIPECFGTYGQPFYWASLPTVPFGLIHPYEADLQDKIEEEELKQEKEAKRAEKMRQLEERLDKEFSAGGVVYRMSGNIEKWSDFTGMLNRHKDDVPVDRLGKEYKDALGCRGVIFEADPVRMKQIAVAAAQSMEIMHKLQELHSKKEIVAAFSKRRAGDDSDLLKIDEDAIRYITKQDLSGLGDRANKPYVFWLLEAYLNTAFPGIGDRGSAEWWFGLYKGRLWFKKLPLWNKIAVAEESKKAEQRLARCMRIWDLGAPEIIKRNELRMLCEYMLYMFGNAIACNSSFEDLFEVTPDGERVTRPHQVETEDGDITEEPEYPIDLPKYDKDGFWLSYKYNADAKKWEENDWRSEDADEIAERAKAHIAELQSLLMRAKGQSFQSVEDLFSWIKAETKETVYIRKGEEKGVRLAFSIAADLGTHDCISFGVVTLDGEKPMSASISIKDNQEADVMPPCFISTAAKRDPESPVYFIEGN